MGCSEHLSCKTKPFHRCRCNVPCKAHACLGRLSRLYRLSLLASTFHALTAEHVHAKPVQASTQICAAAQQPLHCVCTDAARASKEDVLLLYANKWRQHIKQSCVSLAHLLQVPDAAPLHAAIQAAWPFTDQVQPLHFCALFHVGNE